jgi:branched-chain amino acid transport system ATP-binding protein
MLRIEGVHVAYGGVGALRDCSLEVEQASFVAVLGANGAGKSTLLHTIARLTRQRAGHLYLDGLCIDRWRPDRVARAGVALVPEGRRLFGSLSVRENLETAALRLPRAEVDAGVERVLDILPALRGRLTVAAARLSGGEQQMLAIARALVGGPRLLLVDELSMGLAPAVIHRIYGVLRAVNAQGVTVVVVEQYAELALRVAREAVVLERGQVVFRGTPEELHTSAGLLETAYLGRVEQASLTGTAQGAAAAGAAAANGTGNGRHLPAVAEVRFRLEGPVKRRLEEEAARAGMGLEEWLHGVASAASARLPEEGSR